MAMMMMVSRGGVLCGTTSAIAKAGARSAVGCGCHCLPAPQPSGRLMSTTRPLLCSATVSHEELDEEALLRSLVQDAFRPASAAAAVAAPSPPVPAQPALSPDCASGEGEQKRAVTAGTPVSRVRAANAHCEPFCRIRRKTYTYTINERKGLVSSEEALEWMCMQCQTFNFAKRSTCRQCDSFATDSHRDKFPPARQVVLFPAAWLCGGCGGHNGTGAPAATKPTIAGVPSGAKSSREKFICQHCSAPFRGACDWCCPDCHNMNPKAAVQCASCSLDRPLSWACGGCGHAGNSIFSLACLKCERPQEPVMESDAVVRCTNCASRNDVRWELCESCMAPLPELVAVMHGRQRDSRAAAAARATPPPASCATTTTATPTDEKPAGDVSSPAPPALPEEPRDSWESRGMRPTVGGELEGSWWCHTCNVIQRRNAPFCDICLQPRFLAQTSAHPATAESSSTAAPHGTGRITRLAPGGSWPAPGTPPPAPPQIAPGAWQCPYCRQYNLVTQRGCCDKDREVPQGYWLCAECASTNRTERKQCLGCSAAPPEGSWKCTVCQAENTADAGSCSCCAGPHPSLWRCPSCGASAHESEEQCSGCSGARPPPAPHVKCPVCHAPNTPTRKSCFRCRGRLQDDGWRCAQCDDYVADPALLRCPSCRAARDFHTAEETWVCIVCETAIASGGALPVRSQCPRCGGDRDKEHGLCFPSRWRCRRCRLHNRAVSPNCTECGEKRSIPELHAAVHCPHCFRGTALDSAETCTHCRGSLSALLTDAGTSISQAGRGIFAALEGVDEPRSVPPPDRSKPSASALTEDDEEESAPLVEGAAGVVADDFAAEDENARDLPEDDDDAEPENAPFHDDSLIGTNNGGEDGIPPGSNYEEHQADEEHLQFIDEGSTTEVELAGQESFLGSWTCSHCDGTNTDEYLGCVSCGKSRS